MKIYTKTGDKGDTSLLGGKRVAKSSLRIEAYGTVDELNSHLGFARALVLPKEIDEELLRLQSELFVLGGAPSYIAYRLSPESSYGSLIAIALILPVVILNLGGAYYAMYCLKHFLTCPPKSNPF